MRRAISLTNAAIDEAGLLRTRAPATAMGAVVIFLGTVRTMEKERAIAGIEYEAFEKMAHRQFDLIFDVVEKKWPVDSVRVVHRVGQVAVGEASVWLEVVAPHRPEAFAASQFIIAEMKRVVPIWKKIIEKSP